MLAAKVLVLSRLLVKAVSDSSSNRSIRDREALEEAKKKLGGLRRRLLRAIDRTAEKVGEDNREDAVQALLAYSLSTSSGAKDVLRHFLHVRGEAIALSFEDESMDRHDSPGVLRALDLYAKTLLDVQALVPRRLSDGLESLKTKALLKDETLREAEGLRLDICEKWFGDEIMFFIPYIRHDDIEGTQAVEMLKGWAQKGLEVLLKGVAQTLERTADFKSVVNLRTKILEIWIREGGRPKGFDPSILLNGLRKAINDRMVELLESRVNKLHLISTEIEVSVSTLQTGTTERVESLWDEDIMDVDISNGAVQFKEDVLTRTYGRNNAVSRVFEAYQTWRHLVEEISAVIEQLKKQRWDDDLEDIEDDLSLASRNSLLSLDDPQLLQHHLISALKIHSLISRRK